MGISHTVNSEATKAFMHKQIDNDFEQHKYSTYECRYGADRSIDQNALFHVWALEYGCFLAKMPTKGLDQLVREGIIEGMKRAAKKRFYQEFRYSWMVFSKIMPVQKSWRNLWQAQDQNIKDFRSSKNYKTPEMFEFLTWLQATAINDGCLLESKGQFDKKQREAKGI